MYSFETCLAANCAWSHCVGPLRSPPTAKGTTPEVTASRRDAKQTSPPCPCASRAVTKSSRKSSLLFPGGLKTATTPGACINTRGVDGEPSSTRSGASSVTLAHWTRSRSNAPETSTGQPRCAMQSSVDPQVMPLGCKWRSHIASMTPKACCHWPTVWQALLAATWLISLGATRTPGMLVNRQSAKSHRPPVPHALMAAP
mmetsp:Transcript_25935/g.81540  ORF Transcript_25935/g.81540 Transcript_25935/m.81540 type:complete len:200 (+) Transcript_25935:245-844(+)